MGARRQTRNGFARLELLLALAVLALILQMFPSLWFGILWVLDARNWSRGMWLALNLGVVLVLFGIRFRRELTPVVLAILSATRESRIAHRTSEGSIGSDADYEARIRRDAEWRERARKRLPFT